MSDSLSPDEVRTRYIEAMGEELGALFYVLTTELTWAYWRWQQFLDLFGDKPSRIELANRAAPFFFWVVQRTLWDDVLLTIAWLTGPEKSAGKPNLTLRRLPALIPGRELREGIEADLTVIVAASAFAQERRNRSIAHRDLRLALGHAAEKLPEASRREIDHVLDAIACLLNRLEAHYTRSATAFRGFAGTRGATDLLSLLRDGLKFQDRRDERLQNGDYRSEDWEDDRPV